MSQTIKTDLPPQAEVPEFLCVDLDGSLLDTDAGWESLLAVLGEHPWYAFVFPFWLLFGGLAGLKRKIAERAPLNFATLPLRNDVVEFLRQEKQKGRKLILATGADRSIATAMAERVDLFDAVLASDGRTNNAGKNKRVALQKLLEGKEFDYVGNARVDFPIWEHAKTAILVAPTAELLAAAQKKFSVGTVFARRDYRWSAVWRTLRPKQWVKNLLVFVPLVMAHELRDPVRLGQALLAFVSFSLCASGIYVVNDLFDLESDRLHPTKKNRPFASGSVPLWPGLTLAPLLVAAGLLLAAVASSWQFLAVVVVYVIAAILYSTYAKRIPMVDVLLLTGFYLLRILGGGAATGIPVSPWLLALSMFLLLSLAFAKRYMELAVQPADAGQPGSISKRNYSPKDADLVRQFGITSGYISVLVLALYVNGREVTELYRQPQWIWLACPLLLFWISRVWFLANRGVLHEDPVMFAMRDSVSYVLGFIILLIFLAAS